MRWKKLIGSFATLLNEPYEKINFETRAMDLQSKSRQFSSNKISVDYHIAQENIMEKCLDRIKLNRLNKDNWMSDDINNDNLKKYLYIYTCAFDLYRILTPKLKLQIIKEIMDAIYKNKDVIAPTLYRGQLITTEKMDQILSNYKIGQVISRPTIMTSWSEDKNVAESFSNTNNRCVNKNIENNVPILYVLDQGSAALNLSDYVCDKWRWQKEWLVGGRYYVIKSIDRDVIGNDTITRTEIHLQQEHKYMPDAKLLYGGIKTKRLKKKRKSRKTKYSKKTKRTKKH